jgi:predicted membrane chloride channel (bestrophin family)
VVHSSDYIPAALRRLLFNRTRDLARQIVTYVRDEPARHRRTLGFIVAVAAAEKRHLRNERRLQELETVLSIKDVRNIQEAQHMPLFCIDVLRNYIREAYASGKISDCVLQLMNSNLTTFQDTAETRTQIPVAFVVHMRAFMILWRVTLPLTLAESTGWTTIMVCFIVDDLQLGRICETIEKNVREIVDRSLLTEMRFQESRGHVRLSLFFFLIAAVLSRSCSRSRARARERQSHGETHTNTDTHIQTDTHTHRNAHTHTHTMRHGRGIGAPPC